VVISFLNKQAYCRKCSRHLKIGKVWKECVQCKKRFAISKYRDNIGKGKFCSPACKYEYRSLNPDSFKKKYKFTYTNGGVVMMRSSWEVKFAVFLEKLGIEFEYEKHSIVTSYGRYYPDFYIPYDKSFAEVKGYFTRIAKCKYEEAISKGWVIQLFDKDALKSLGILP